MEWIGGYLKVDNSSSGYHKVLLQWAEKHLENTLDQEYDVLIVGEGESAKKNFNEYYPSWNVYTIDRSLEFTHGNVDILGDISDENVLNEKVYDIVLCQSVLEHAFDPVMAMKNMIKSLKDGGVLSVCTHPVGPPGFPYHGSGTCSDYYRFYGDFFLNFIKETGLNAQCVEGFQNDTHIMACYKKLRGI